MKSKIKPRNKKRKYLHNSTYTIRKYGWLRSYAYCVLSKDALEDLEKMKDIIKESLITNILEKNKSKVEKFNLIAKDIKFEIGSRAEDFINNTKVLLAKIKFEKSILN